MRIDILIFEESYAGTDTAHESCRRVALDVRCNNSMLKDLSTAERNLANYMSEISERAYNAQWIGNLEFVLWNALTNGARNFGREQVTNENIDKLRSLASACGSWIHFDEEKEEIAVPIDKWKDLYSEKVTGNPKILAL
jgi:hypothetical protein